MKCKLTPSQELARELSQLRAENARLAALLDAHGIAWRQAVSKIDTASDTSPASTSGAVAPRTTLEKLALFRRLFRGRPDVHAVRWESKTGKSGYSPACANEWRPGICEKPRIKCSDCGHRALPALTNQTLYDHLAGRHVIGVYPLLEDGGCHFLAVDFDQAEWRCEALAFLHSCRDLAVPAALEISRSGQGAHAWIFFSTRVSARDARRLGTTLISHTCARTRQLELSSYDRLFPNQDVMPQGGFGNLIALPLQKAAREHGASVFVDDCLAPHPDQWAYLASVQTMAAQDIEPTILRATGGAHPLDVNFITEEDQQAPWKQALPIGQRLPGPLPASLSITLASLLYVDKTALPQPLANRLIRLAAFQNPEFYKAQAMRLSVWDKPRIIGCAENFPRHVALPRGCLDAVRDLLQDNGIGCELHDERNPGQALTARFVGTLRPDQKQAMAAMLAHDTGVLCAPTAFGKTVIAAAIIARRAVSTLILVHRTDLLRQWRERLGAFLRLEEHAIGTVGAGKARPTGRLDIAVMQSLVRQGQVKELVESYGQVIVDECHHLPAFSFEAILKRVRARYVCGLTATPIRRDGHQPIIFMQCGPVRHVATPTTTALQTLELVPRHLPAPIAIAHDAGIQDVFRHLIGDTERTAAIAREIVEAFAQGRKILVLTERAAHIDAIVTALADRVPALFILHGRMSGTQRARLIQALEALPPDAPRVLVSTGKLVGEGFDHPPLDTLVLAMPISWKGRVQQYAGRLHREHAGKRQVRIIDFVDSGHPALQRMWTKRLRGYLALGYRSPPEATNWSLDFTPSIIEPAGMQIGMA